MRNISFVFLPILLISVSLTPTHDITITPEEKPLREGVRGQIELIQSERPEILARIAFCESGDRHFDENGEVIRGRENPQDIGRYQINLKYWGDKAEELGLDLFDEQDNETMALWIYERQGSQPWFWSEECWDKPTANK